MELVSENRQKHEEDGLSESEDDLPIERKRRSNYLPPEGQIHQIIAKRRKVLQDEKEKIDAIELFCPICRDFIVSASTTVCGHSFCERCLFEWVIFSKDCPVCRSNVRGVGPHTSLMIDNIIERVISGEQYKSDHEKWKLKHTAHKEWIKNKQLRGIESGMKVDVRDTEYIWCHGLIKLKITYPDAPAVLLVHYDGWSRIYDEFVPENSPRIAPLGFFSSRTDIPRYILNGDNCRFGYVVVGNHEIRPEGAPEEDDDSDHVELEGEELEDEEELIELAEDNSGFQEIILSSNREEAANDGQIEIGEEENYAVIENSQINP